MTSLDRWLVLGLSHPSDLVLRRKTLELQESAAVIQKIHFSLEE